MKTKDIVIVIALAIPFLYAIIQDKPFWAGSYLGMLIFFWAGYHGAIFVKRKVFG